MSLSDNDRASAAGCYLAVISGGDKLFTIFAKVKLGAELMPDQPVFCLPAIVCR